MESAAILLMGNQWQSLLFETCLDGVSSAVAPELLPDNQLPWGKNISTRGGKPSTRAGWIRRCSLPPGLIQGCEYFGVQGGMLVAQIAGVPYKIRILGEEFETTEITLPWINSPIIKQVWMTQTVETLIIQDGQSNPILYNGSTAVRSDPGDDEVPLGRQMAYLNGRLWVAVNDREILAGDIRTNTPGSELLFTESEYLSGGGRLYFPRGVTAMSPIPTTGTTDYGALLVFGRDYTEAIRADITQRDLWASYPGFVTTVLRNIGCAGQWSITQVNQDLYWRDSFGGLRSLRSSLADESGPGNSPISREVSRLFDFDSNSLLGLCSSVYFDNRLLTTSSPYLSQAGGVGWKDLGILDFALVSTMRGKSPPAWSGEWEGLRFSKLVAGQFLNVPRAFALTSDENQVNELWEFTSDVDSPRADIYELCSDGTGTETESPITCYIEYPRRDFGRPKERKRLERFDVWLSDIDGTVEVQAYWRSDNNQQWTQWDEFEVCAKTTDSSTDSPHVWKNLLKQQRPQVKTFTIPDGVDSVTSYGLQTGYEFQIRLVWTGRCQIERAMLHAAVLPDPDYANREETVTTCLENNVTDNEVNYAIPSSGCPCLELTVSTGSGAGETVFDNGTVEVDSVTIGTSGETEFTITNEGDGVLTVTDFELTSGTGSFELVDAPDEEIPAGDSSTFTVRLLGESIGVKTGIVTFGTNSTCGGVAPEFTFNLVGTVLPNDPGEVSLTCTSESGTAEMCGFSEYTSPSSPPKKYRTQTLSGYSDACQFSAGCNPPRADRTHDAYTGAYTYNVSTCAQTNNQLRTQTADPTPPWTCGTATPGRVNNGTALAAQNFTPAMPGSVQTTTQTTDTFNYDNCDGGTNVRKLGSVVATLSDEDTIADAIARASVSVGTSCTAAVETRSAADFIFQFVTVGYDLDCTGLVAGIDYRVTVTLTTENYGGGSPVVSTQDYTFTATGTTETISDVIDCPYGKQVTVSNPVIQFDV